MEIRFFSSEKTNGERVSRRRNAPRFASAVQNKVFPPFSVQPPHRATQRQLCYVRLAAAVADKKNLDHVSLRAVIRRLMPSEAAFCQIDIFPEKWALSGISWHIAA